MTVPSEDLSLTPSTYVAANKPYVTPILGDPMLFSGLLRHQAHCTSYIYTHAGKILMHLKAFKSLLKKIEWHMLINVIRVSPEMGSFSFVLRRR